MSITDLKRDEMKAWIRDLPRNWADIISIRTGFSKATIWHYVNGRRGNRVHQKLLVIYEQMKTLHIETLKKFEKETA